MNKRHINGFLNIQKAFLLQKSMDDYCYIKALLNYIKEEQLFFKSVFSFNSNGYFLYQWKKIIKDDLQKKYLREKTEKYMNNLTFEMVASAVVGAYSYWLYHENEIPISDVIENAMQMWNLNIAK